MKKILIVDDEKNIRYLYKEELEEEGFMVELAKNGQEALEKLPVFKPDLITLDIKMPEMDGIETLKRIREIERHLPIIMCSAYGEYKQDITTWASDAYVVKCADLAELKYSIGTLLSKNPQELETARIKHLEQIAAALTKENEQLKEKIKKLSGKGKGIKAYEDADQYRSIMAATAHSLRSEFTNIGSSIRNIKEIAAGALDIQEECDVIERSIHYSQLLLRRLHDYLDIGKPSVVPVDILEVLRGTESLVRPRLSTDIQLKIKIPQSLNERRIKILANVEQLMEVLLELINNAVNVLREKGGTIELELKRKNMEIAISVRDDGPGIPEETRKNIFKKQVSSKSGLGLGLFLCNKVLNALGGKLNFQTSSEEGTVFTILLPVTGDKKENQ